jgi:hypothetical protein
VLRLNARSCAAFSLLRVGLTLSTHDRRATGIGSMQPMPDKVAYG